MKVKNIMTEDVITVEEDDSLRKAAKLLKKNDISGAPVVDEKNELVGIISEEDILKSFKEEQSFEHDLWLPSPFELVEIPIRGVLDLRKYEKLLEETGGENVSSVMTKNVYSVSPDDDVSDVAEVMTVKRINRVPVLEDSKVVGIVARGDIINSLVE